MAFGSRGNVASAKQKVSSSLSLRKLFNFVNLYSMQKGVAAIKPVHSCSQGVPEMGTGSRYQPWDGRRASSEWGMENSFLLWEGTTGPYWDCTSSDCWHRWVDSMHSSKGLWWWQVGGEKEKLSSAKSGILSLH